MLELRRQALLSRRIRFVLHDKRMLYALMRALSKPPSGEANLVKLYRKLGARVQSEA